MLQIPRVDVAVATAAKWRQIRDPLKH